MELILFILFFVAIAGGLQWCFKRFLDARDYTRGVLADHPIAYQLAGAFSFLSGIAMAIAVYQDEKSLSLAGAGLIACLIGLILIPVWFVVMLVLGFIYRTLIAPTLGVLGFLIGLVISVVSILVSPFRRRREAVDDSHARTARQEEAERERYSQKRRENARTRCELFYTLHAPEIGPRFTRAMLDDYLRRFMGDNRPPEEVEERTAALEAMLHQHLEKVQPTPKFRRLEDIARWFDEQKQQLDSIADDRLRQTLLAKLKARYAELTTQFLEEMQT